MVPAILLKNYPDTLEAFLRYCRNLLVHAEQNVDSIEAFFGKRLSDEELLNEILKEVPKILVHLLWFGKRNFPELSFAANFPTNCAKAYEETMRLEANEIGGAMEELFDAACSDPKSTSVKDEDEEATELFKESHKKIKKVLQDTAADFKPLKERMQKLDRERVKLERRIEGLKISAEKSPERSEEDIDSLKTELAEVKKKLEMKWKVLQQPESYVKSKYLGFF